MCKQYKIGQSELKYIYDNAQKRMGFHAEIAERYKTMVNELPVYKNRNEAIKNAINTGCQVWAKIGKDEEYYYIQNHYIVSNDNRLLMAAEYIGMVQIYC